MKYTQLYYLAFVLVIIILVSLYFELSKREGFIARIDPSIINTNVQSGDLGQNLLQSHLSLLNSQLSGIRLNQINIVASPLGKVQKGQTKLLLNGKSVPGIPTVLALTRFLSDQILTMTSAAESIDINYTQPF